MSLTLGGFTFDVEKALRYLKQDIRDDWYQDPLLFGDRLKKEDIKAFFEKNIAANGGIYAPTKRKMLNVPKSRGTLRYSLETHFYDRMAYQSFGIPLIQYFDPLISRRVLSHRFDEEEFFSGKSRYIFLNSIEQWKKFEEYVRVGAKDKTILVTDLQNYFENINIDKLHTILLGKVGHAKIPASDVQKVRFCVDSIAACLKSWSYNGVNGLPQNRDVSSFLANIYMLPTDSAMMDSKADYYRYMDDIRIVCADKFEARQWLKKLTLLLRTYGLSLNAAKTEIIEPGTARHQEFMSYGEFQLERLDAMIRSKKKPIVALAFTEVRDMLENLQEGENFTARAFRFAVARVCKIALCAEIAKPPGFFDAITEKLVTRIPDLPEVADQFYDYFMAVDLAQESLDQIKSFLLNQRVAVYGWQNYLLWRVLVYKNMCDKDLLTFAGTVITSSKNIADISGALLYLGKCGEDSDRKLIVAAFERFDDFITQRHAFIAIQELDFKWLKGKVESHVLQESVGIYRTLREYKVPKYIEPPASIKYTDLIREVAFYA